MSVKDRYLCLYIYVFVTSDRGAYLSDQNQGDCGFDPIYPHFKNILNECVLLYAFDLTSSVHVDLCRQTHDCKLIFLFVLISRDMQEVKEELREERDKRMALQVSEARFEFCMDHTIRNYAEAVVIYCLNVFSIQDEVHSLRMKH